MIGWSIVAVYVLGWLVSGVMYARHRKDADIRDHGIDFARRMQAFTLWSSVALAVFWPVLVPAWVLTPGFNRLTTWAMRTRTERYIEQDRELRRLRKQAQALGLPYPGEDR